MTACIVLRLSGPQQSWGSTHFSTRNTEMVPTRSGIIGMCAGALGARRGEFPTWLDELSLLARVDLTGDLSVDFHTVNPPPSDIAVLRNKHRDFFKTSRQKPQTLNYVIPMANGKPWTLNKKVHPMVSPRAYLADSVFMLAIHHDNPETLKELAAALRSPHFMNYLGRKSFSPTFPYFLGMWTGEPRDVLARLPVEERTKTRRDLGSEAVPEVTPHGMYLHDIVGDQNYASGEPVFPPRMSDKTELWKEWSRGISHERLSA